MTPVAVRTDQKIQHSGHPPIAMLFYFIGAISGGIGIIGFLIALSSRQASEEMAVIVGAFIGGAFFLGFGYALHKLAQIESHLRSRA